MFLSTFCLLARTGFPPVCLQNGEGQKREEVLAQKKLERGRNTGKSRKEGKMREEVRMREK